MVAGIFGCLYSRRSPSCTRLTLVLAHICEDSELCRLNRAEICIEDLSPDFTEVLELSARYERVSGGAFSARPAGRALDTNAIVKGWAVQRASDILRAAGILSFCFNAGGDVIVHGVPAAGRHWNVGVRSPADPRAMLAVLSVTNAAVATSGTYERGSHIWDGTGAPARGLISVTVVADDLVTADILATTVFALGPPGVGWAACEFDCRVLALTEQDDILTGGDVESLLATEE